MTAPFFFDCLPFGLSSDASPVGDLQSNWLQRPCSPPSLDTPSHSSPAPRLQLRSWHAAASLTDGIFPWGCHLDDKDKAAELGPDDQVWAQAGCITFGWEGEAMAAPQLLAAFRRPESDKVGLVCQFFPSPMKVILFQKVVWAF